MEHVGKTDRKTAVLLVNLGTPDQPTRSAVKKYLKQFLSDRRVIEVNPLLWQLILRLIILPIRTKKTAKLYQKIWNTVANISPLMFYAKSITTKLNQLMPAGTIVDFAMRYGAPSIAEKIANLCDQGVTEIKVLPLYPQYSATTTASVYDEIYRLLTTMRWQPNIIGMSPYYDHPQYIKLLVQAVREHFAQLTFVPDVLLFSFHGIPQRYFDQGDPYYCHCHKTYRLAKEILVLENDFDLEIKLSFQSRFGPKKWLKPYTAEILEQYAAAARNVVIIAPGFATDCLETLEELKVTERQKFIAKGGQHFSVVPCLNDNRGHIQLIKSMVIDNMNWDKKC